jgi:hypothetical protein
MIGILDIAVLLVECPLSTDENTTRSWERHFPPKKSIHYLLKWTPEIGPNVKV